MRSTLTNTLLSCIVLLAFVAQIQTQTAKLLNLDFEKKLPDWMKETNVPAVGVGIIENGKLTYTKVFGELKKGNPGVPAPQNTIFQVASLTKPIVEILTLQLVTRGEWNLDEPLANYWVDPDVENDPRHKQLTTRHVLTHQSGFPNWRYLNASNKLEFIADPGTKVGYSGEGLEYLRHALEKKFKQPLEQLAQKRLFQSYGMTNTRFFWDESIVESRFAVPHNKDGKPYDIHKNLTTNAADLLLTTVEDYGRFAVNVLKSRGLSPEVFAEMVRPQVKYPSGTNMFFGLGWMVMPDLSNGEYALIHTGSDPGVNTVVILFPKSQRGLIVFTNGENGAQVWTRIVADAFEVGKEMLGRG
ncbi:MAG TPA: serine hydrolase domain-containing protein [Pyrinomonadaceae bacterium]|jgi:CubicO group peptidase (beta-lactamase class C family)|nr:serine hydrolase domain-containing protein [Pyrinomonadaceae bacterium]